MINKLLKYWKPAIIAIIICYGSLTSGSNLNKVHFLNIKNLDKLIHFLMYLTLSLTLYRALLKNISISRREIILLNLVFVISYGLIMEVLQFYITTDRSADIYDGIANTIGTIFGIILYPFIVKINLHKYL